MDIKKSCVFNKEPVEKLNKLAQAADGRLFLFAYYNPKPFPENESAVVQFYTAVINLYGLIWDCGPFIRNLLGRKKQYGLLERDSHGNLSAKSKKINDTFYQLQNNLSGLRNAACHNTASEYFFNQQNIDNAEDFFINLGLSPGALLPGDWKKCLDELCRLAIETGEGIEYGLNCLAALPPPQKDKVINFWLNDCLCQWYKTKKKDLDGYLEELKIWHAAKFRKKEMYLSTWLKGNFGIYDSSSLITEALLSALLNDPARCPKPALPLPVFMELSKEIYNFAASDKHK